jgi:hypothetical protein
VVHFSLGSILDVALPTVFFIGGGSLAVILHVEDKNNAHGFADVVLRGMERARVREREKRREERERETESQ